MTGPKEAVKGERKMFLKIELAVNGAHAGFVKCRNGNRSHKIRNLLSLSVQEKKLFYYWNLL